MTQRPDQTTTAEPLGWLQASDPVAGARMLQRTQRNSRRVQVARMVVQGLLLVIALLVVAWPQIAPKVESFQLGYLTHTGVLSDMAMRVENPRFVGVDSHQRPFTVTASEAFQKENDAAAVIMLRGVDADITLDNGAWLNVKAGEGAYQRQIDKLDLSSGVKVYHDAGYELQTTALLVDLALGQAVSTTSVTGQGPMGTLRGATLAVLERGAIIKLAGPARLSLRWQSRR